MLNENGISVLLCGKPFACECKHAGFFQTKDKTGWECVMCGRYYSREDGKYLGRNPDGGCGTNSDVTDKSKGDAT